MNMKKEEPKAICECFNNRWMVWRRHGILSVVSGHSMYDYLYHPVNRFYICGTIGCLASLEEGYISDGANTCKAVIPKEG